MASVNIQALTGGTILTASAAGGVIDPNLQATVQGLAQQMASALSWIPYDIVGVMTLAMNQGSYPYPIQNPATPIPPWLNDPNRIASWQQAAAGWVPITQAFLQGQLNAAISLGQQLQANTDFWNNVALYSGADAVQNAWDKLWQALGAFKAQRDAAAAAISVANGVLNDPVYGPRLPAQYGQINAGLSSQLSQLSSTVSTIIAPLGAAGRSAAGLGVAPLIVVGVAATVVAGITASVMYYVNQMASIQTNANNNANALLAAKQQMDESDFRSGKITEQQLEARTAQLENASQTLASAAAAANTGFLGIFKGSPLKVGLELAAAGAGIVALILLIRRMRSRAA